MPKLYSDRLSKIRGKQVYINSNGNERLSDAEDRVINQNPDIFGGESSSSSSIHLPSEVDKLRTMATDPKIQATIKERKELMSLYESVRDDFLKRKGIDPEADTKKAAVAEALLMQLARLPEIETGEGLVGLYQAARQTIGSYGLDPAATGYKQAQEQLKIPMLRKLMGEVGATMEKEQEAAKSLFPSGLGLYMKNTRPELLENTFSNVKSMSGVDLRKRIEENYPDLLEQIGAYPKGSPKLLEKRLSGNKVNSQKIKNLEDELANIENQLKELDLED